MTYCLSCSGTGNVDHDLGEYCRDCNGTGIVQETESQQSKIYQAMQDDFEAISGEQNEN